MKGLVKAATALAVMLAMSGAMAQAPQVGTQAPGYFRLAVGDYEVTALFDGYNDLSPKLLQGMSQSQIRALLARRSIETPGVQTAFNAFLVNTGTQLILVDTGAGQCIGATAGQLSANMQVAGYKPEQVDTILLTHLHLDHVCGLVDAEKKPVFANATVFAAKAEADYWLDPAALANAPAGAKEFFKIAQDSTAPYVAAGRFKTFAAGQSPLPGLVEATLEAGHTPGSTTYRFTSQQQSIVFMGDLVHNLAVQFLHPEVSIGFDVNSQQAIASRQAVFSAAAASKTWVTAAHLPFPGIGHIAAEGKHFQWVPVEYGPYKRAAKVPLIE
ncbi:MBL fold metallo-hydrolase [Pseudomonas koreensis]|uniref:MBL fold metallo-hydrolase n=1 Tax=Pseudomonas atacamensis TaxID=2565368 RepID=A0AAQ2D7Y7_9PSED|nr:MULTISPECIES: MBL fold metallo-hydrolase [Pseudomonas]MCW0920936.1 MBL fold metallo-hydrolase [Pseudomonas sp. RG1]OFJ45774.1 MBL fold metallo-hydrolase [Pseudomonas koreensis]QXH75039.1 MBL fold metallo-hydrolase [Pseudomonas atacamensis]THF27810.1 MBL fold metallo-hydrolase [Pseudomonas atacamensis]